MREGWREGGVCDGQAWAWGWWRRAVSCTLLVGLWAVSPSSGEGGQRDKVLCRVLGLGGDECGRRGAVRGHRFWWSSSSPLLLPHCALAALGVEQTPSLLFFQHNMQQRESASSCSYVPRSPPGSVLCMPTDQVRSSCAVSVQAQTRWLSCLVHAQALICFGFQVFSAAVVA
jgi:hypothetical protein